MKSVEVVAAKAKTAALEAYKLKPNAMQARFVHNLKSLMEEGAERALLVSATGDGGIIVSSQAKTA